MKECQLNYKNQVYNFGDLIITGYEFDEIFKKLLSGKITNSD